MRNAAAGLKQARKIEILQHPTQGVVFVAVSDDFASRFSDLSDEHRVVYKLVADASIQGIWAKDLASKSKIPTGTLARVTRMLEHRKLIKQITPAQFRSRKVWMLYELEPASEISGGSWYKDGQIDSTLIEQLRSLTIEYLSNCPEPVVVDEVQKFLASQGMSRSADNILAIIKTLVLDRKVMQLEGHVKYPNKPCYFIERGSSIPEFSSSAFGQIPCIACPIRSECRPGHVISPESCQYMNRWLGLSDSLGF